MSDELASDMVKEWTEEQAKKSRLDALAPAGMVPMGDTIRRDAVVTLSKDEHLQISQRMADMMGTVEDLRNKKATIGAQIKQADATIAEMCNVVKFGRDVRPVTCHQYANFATGQVSLVRMDTGEVISTRAMEHGERQLELDLETEAETAEGGEEADEGGEE